MAALNSATECRQYLRGLILQKGGKASRKVHPPAAPHGFANNQLKTVGQNAEFQRVFSFRVEDVVAQTPVILQVEVGSSEVRPHRGEGRTPGTVGSDDNQTNGLPICERDIRANDPLPGL